MNTKTHSSICTIIIYNTNHFPLELNYTGVMCHIGSLSQINNMVLAAELLVSNITLNYNQVSIQRLQEYPLLCHILN